MSKTKLLPIVIFALILGGIFSCSVSRAQEAMPESVSLGEIVAVAEVNIFDAKIVSQEENKIRISFDLANGESVQPEVKYAVRLIRSSETEQVVVDEKIYEEVLDLKNGETLKKEIEYSAPAYLEGTFQLWLMAQNQSGLDLSLSNAGEISLMGNNRYIEIIPESCYLKVEGEAEDVRYSLFQGVDIKSE
ncbi:MAG: hypothetical protein Q8L10_05515, partial [Candidatus Moranbacteria bacterium]|nr:hypothetical protein [Candidatus Moranbacteria bacterium]